MFPVLTNTALNAHVGVYGCIKKKPSNEMLLVLPHHAAWVAHAPAGESAPTRTR